MRDGLDTACRGIVSTCGDPRRGSPFAPRSVRTGGPDLPSKGARHERFLDTALPLRRRRTAVPGPRAHGPALECATPGGRGTHSTTPDRARGVANSRLELPDRAGDRGRWLARLRSLDPTSPRGNARGRARAEAHASAHPTVHPAAHPTAHPTVHAATVHPAAHTTARPTSHTATAHTTARPAGHAATVHPAAHAAARPAIRTIPEPPRRGASARTGDPRPRPGEGAGALFAPGGRALVTRVASTRIPSRS